jgi:HK97 family phage major capsid protein
VVRDDLVTAAANAEDLACLKGSGLAGQPKGIYYWIGDAGRTDTAGTSLAQVRQDVRVAKNYLDSNNAPNVRRAWFMHSRSMNFMGWDLVDGNSNFAFQSLQSSGGASLGGDPVYRDNNITITAGSGDKSEIYYVEMSECYIGDGPGMEIEIFNDASYSASGTIRSGISRDESVIRLIRKMDFGMRHLVSAHIIEAVAYGV